MHFTRYLEGWRQQEIVIVLILGLLSILLWNQPVARLFLYPFHLFVTFVHELCHGLAAIATGGKFLRFAVEPNLSGHALSSGGVNWIVTSAGYLGSTVFGSALILLSAWQVSARMLLFWLGVILAVMCVLFVRNGFGIFAGLVLSAGLIFAGRQLNDQWADALLLFLAVQTALQALNSVFDLISFATHLPGVRTDAQIMSSMTGIPALFWAVLWSILSILILGITLYIAYRRIPPF